MHGLNHYLLSNERGTDIISQNKEGIFSIFGKNCDLALFNHHNTISCLMHFTSDIWYLLQTSFFLQDIGVCTLLVFK